MSGPVQPPLEVTDGTTSVRPTRSITFDAADGFTVSDNGSGRARVDVSGGASSTLTATQIGYGDSSNVMTSSDKLVFIDTPAGNEALGVGLAAPNEYSSNATTIQVHDATTAEIRLTNTTTGSSGTVGQLFQAFEDDLYIFNAETSGKIFFATNKQVVATIDETGQVGIGINPPESTLDVRSTDEVVANFESTDESAAVAIDSPDNGYSVVFFREAGSSLWSVGKLGGGSDEFNIYNESATGAGTNGSVVRIDRANNFNYNVNYDASKFNIFSGSGVALDIVTTSDVEATIALETTGTGGTEWRIVSGANGSGIGGGNFGFYSMSYNGYVWTAGEDGLVGIGAFPGDSDVERLHVKGTGTAGAADEPLVRLESTDTDEYAGPTLEMQRDVPGATDDLLGEIDFKGQKADGTAWWYSRIGTRITDATNGYGRIQFWVAGVGDASPQDETDINRAQLTVNAGDVTINNSNRGNVDFIVKKGGSGRFIDCDASASVMGLSGAPTSGGSAVQIKGDVEFLKPANNAYTASATLNAVDAKNMIIVANMASGSQTLALPTGEIGMHVTIVNINTNGVIVEASSPDTINGATSVSTTTENQIIECYFVAANRWIASEPAVAA